MPSSTRKPSRRLRSRKLYDARATVDGGELWLVARGAHVTRTDADGARVSEVYEPGARLWSNPGDRLVVCGPTIEETATARVVEVAQDGRVRVQLTCGVIAAGTARVRVMEAGRA